MTNYYKKKKKFEILNKKLKETEEARIYDKQVKEMVKKYDKLDPLTKVCLSELGIIVPIEGIDNK